MKLMRRVWLLFALLAFGTILVVTSGCAAVLPECALVKAQITPDGRYVVFEADEALKLFERQRDIQDGKCRRYPEGTT